MKSLALIAASITLATACGSAAPETTMPDPESSSPTTTQVATSTEPSNAPPTPASPTLSEVSFPSDDLMLVGDLRLPVGEQLPAVVLIHGSGPSSRNASSSGQLNLGFGFEIHIFDEIANALQDAGFVVLTYDKRTCGPFNGCSTNSYPTPPNDLTVEAFIDDAHAAVSFLREQPQVATDQVSVIGYSQGAEFIPGMLIDDASLNKGVLLGGPFRPIDELMEFQYDSSLELLQTLGPPEEQALDNPALVQLNETLAGHAAIREGDITPVAGVSADFWNSWFTLGLDKTEAIRNLTQPVLILNGEFDWNVPPSEAALWDEAFVAANKEHTVVTLPCVTHALNCVTESDLTRIDATNIGTSVAPEVMVALLAFLTS